MNCFQKTSPSWSLCSWKAQRIIGLLRQQKYDKEIFIHGALEKLCNYYVEEKFFRKIFKDKPQR